MSKSITYKDFANIFGEIKEFDSDGTIQTLFVLTWLNCKEFSQDRSE